MINDRENDTDDKMIKETCVREVIMELPEIVRRSGTRRIKNYNKYINDFIRGVTSSLPAEERWSPVAPVHRDFSPFFSR